MNRQEIELEVSRILERGDITHISRLSGVGYSYVNQQLNPNDLRKSPIVGFLEIQTALDARSEERGERLWQVVRRRRELARKPRPSAVCVRSETSKLNKEHSDVINSVLIGADLDAHLTELLELESQIAVVIEAVLSGIHRERENESI